MPWVGVRLAGTQASHGRSWQGLRNIEGTVIILIEAAVTLGDELHQGVPLVLDHELLGAVGLFRKLGEGVDEDGCEEVQ